MHPRASPARTVASGKRVNAIEISAAAQVNLCDKESSEALLE